MSGTAAGEDFVVVEFIPISDPQYFSQALKVKTVKNFELYSVWKPESGDNYCIKCFNFRSFRRPNAVLARLILLLICRSCCDVTR